MDWNFEFALSHPIDMNCICELRRLTGLLFSPPVIHERGEPQWNDIDGGKPKNSDKKNCPGAIFPTTNHT
jgi:hypothetical protein